MINKPENVTVVFNEDGKSFTELMEQILKILIKSTGEGEADCKRKL